MATQGQVFGRPYPAGQYLGTTTNDDATAGNIGEIASIVVNFSTATVTFTSASPTVVTWTSHPYAINSSGIVSTGVINFTNSGGALPTGISAGTNYYAVPIDANTLHIGSSVANALAGTFVNTSSAGTGTQTGKAQAILSSGAAADIGGAALTAGDWYCTGIMGVVPSGATATVFGGWFSTTSVTAPTLAGLAGYSLLTTTFTAAAAQQMPIGPGRFSLSATTNVFLTNNTTFGSTANGYGVGLCRRMR